MTPPPRPNDLHDTAARRSIDRRSFVATALAGGFALATSAFTRSVAAGSRVRIGCVIPATGRSASRGASFFRGIELGWEEAAQAGRLLGVEAVLLREEGTDPEAVRRCGERLLDQGASALIGGVDRSDLPVLGELADGAGIPFLALAGENPGRARRFCGRNTYFLAPANDAYAGAVVHVLAEESGFRRWVVIGGADEGAFDRAIATVEQSSGTVVATLAGVDPDGPGPIHSIAREAGTDAILMLATPSPAWSEAHAALEDPIPIVLTHPDAAVPREPGAGARQSRAPAHTGGGAGGAGGEPPARARCYWPDHWHPELTRYGAAQLNERYLERFGITMDSDAWSGWMSVKIVWEAALRTGAENGSALVRRLEEERELFDGHKGTGLAFGDDRTLRQPLYALGGIPGLRSQVVGETPLRTPDAFRQARSERTSGDRSSCTMSP